MHNDSRRIRIVAATGVLAAAVLATGSAANTKTPTGTRVAPAKPTVELVRIQSDLYNGDVYTWKVNGVPRGLPMW
jgi:hypothetical protein